MTYIGLAAWMINMCKWYYLMYYWKALFIRQYLKSIQL